MHNNNKIYQKILNFYFEEFEFIIKKYKRGKIISIALMLIY